MDVGAKFCALRVSFGASYHGAITKLGWRIFYTPKLEKIVLC
jgi:hypothetical protein